MANIILTGRWLGMVAGLLYSTATFCQQATAGPLPFDIYVFPEYHTREVVKYLRDNKFSFARMLMQVVIDPDKDQEINRDAVQKQLLQHYPDRNASGLYIIDWEAQPFHDLKFYGENDARFKAAANKYIELIRLVKGLRPNLQVAIYGLPFRFYSPRDRQYNTGKLDYLLRHCDVLAPSLYIMYADEQVGQRQNLQYLQNNMEVALSYGKRLNKPVVPFFWYRVHPGNKNFGLRILSRDEMGRYLNCLADYNYQGTKIKGIVWWEGGGIIKNKRAAARYVGNKSATLFNEVRDSIIVNYTAPLMNRAANSRQHKQP